MGEEEHIEGMEYDPVEFEDKLLNLLDRIATGIETLVKIEGAFGLSLPQRDEGDESVS